MNVAWSRLHVTPGLRYGVSVPVNTVGLDPVPRRVRRRLGPLPHDHDFAGRVGRDWALLMNRLL